MKPIILLFISLFSLSVNAASVCPDERHCLIDYNPKVILVSIYQDGETCTRPLLYDGACPDYLQGGCAFTHSCKDKQVSKKHVVFTDNK
jgi:hypothetical protein